MRAHRVGLRFAILVGWLEFTSPARADDAPKNTTSGLAVGAGLGYQVAGFGGEVLYYQSIGQNWWMVPYVGVGALDGGTGHFKGGVAGGLMGAWGRAHRIVLDVSAGPAAIETTTLRATGEVVDVRSFYGATLAAGYEFVADGGFWVHPTVGATVLFDDPGPVGDRVSFTANATLGYKIW